MSQELFDKFGRLVAKTVRDKGIEHLEIVLKSKNLPPHWEKYENSLDSLTEEQVEFLDELGIQIIDSTIHDFLLLLDDKWVNIELTDENESKHDLKKIAKGSLQGYIFEWIERFSKYKPK